jgi:hypothetical protein
MLGDDRNQRLSVTTSAWPAVLFQWQGDDESWLAVSGSVTWSIG